jgi:hypothetical protein
MNNWLEEFRYNPISPLLSANSIPLQYFIKRDLLEEKVNSIKSLWELPEPKKILSKQLVDGSWPDKNAKKHIDSPTNYGLVETFRNIRILIQMYGFDKNHPRIQKAAEYIFSTQTAEGDFRGVYGNQYCPNYCAAILEMLVRAAYHDEPQIHKCFDWFIDHQMDDGGWVLPLQVEKIKINESENIMRKNTMKWPEKTTISAHSVAGIVIRPFGQHPVYSHHPAALKAAEFLIKRFFKPDQYSSRQSAFYWTKYTFPYWWADLISVLDAMSLMNVSPNTHGLSHALNYYKQHQNPDGTWNFSTLASKNVSEVDLWLTYTLCCIFKRFYDQQAK